MIAEFDVEEAALTWLAEPRNPPDIQDVAVQNVL